MIMGAKSFFFSIVHVRYAQLQAVIGAFMGDPVLIGVSLQLIIAIFCPNKQIQKKLCSRKLQLFIYVYA